MNRQEYERWEMPTPKKPNGSKYIVWIVLALLALYFFRGRMFSFHHDFEEEEVRTNEVMLSAGEEGSENIASQSYRDLENNQEDPYRKTDNIVRKAEDAVNKAKKEAEQAIENAHKTAEDVLGVPYQSHKTEPQKQKDKSKLSDMELLDRISHKRIVDEAKRVGVSTEGSDMEILDRISHKRIVEEARRAGVSAEGSDMEILDRISHKRIVEEARRAGVSAEGSDTEILDRISRKHLERMGR